MTMLRTRGKRNSCAIILFLMVMCCFYIGNVHSASDNWPFAITAQHHPGTYWWAPGSAWDKESIDWNLEKLKEGGIYTVHIVPIYGAKGYEDRYIPFLSDKWVDSLQYILQKADSLGMQVDMTTGTGWCFGGPDLDKNHVDMRGSLDENTGELKIATNRMVKRAAPGGAGHMLNPFSHAAIASYLERFDKALEKCDVLPRAQYHDSFEYNANWCEEMPDEFLKRRGYELTPHIKTLFGNDETIENTSRIKYDYRLTAAELHQEFIQYWADWAKSKGMLTRDQAHGAPANLLDVYATADIPETEMFGSPQFPIPGFRQEEQFCRPSDSDSRICRMASSAAHVAHEPGKQLVSSESCTWMREHWHGTLGQIKLEMDLFFLVGINHVIYHGSCYSAKDAPWPGWFFYASTKADWRNAIWRDMPLLNVYIARCQSMLQAGQPANDVLIYWPIHDLWMDAKGLLKNLTVHDHQWLGESSLGDVASLLDKKGYTFDYISDQMLGRIKCENGELSAPGGDYKVIVVPKCRYMPADTMNQLAKLSQQGAKIIFEGELPADVPGLSGLEKNRDSFAKQKARLKNAIITNDVVAGLIQTGVKSESMVNHGLRFIRRKTSDAYWYFIANHTERAFNGWLDLSSPFASAVIHDPMTGAEALAPTRMQGESKQIYLDIAPGQSLIIQASSIQEDAAPYVALKPTGKEFILSGKWEIEFIDGGPELPQPYSADSLSCWTNAPDKKAQAFAGTARYKLAFDLPDMDEADEYLLDLGDVRESARVKINGETAAELFALPMSACVGKYLRKGGNTIEIEVTNLSANRIRDLSLRKVDWQIMNEINIVNQHYKKFDATQWPLQPSGLLGPVTLKAMEKVTFIIGKM